MVKALGMEVWFNDRNQPTPEDDVGVYFTQVCAVSIDGGGVEASMETIEPCLDDLVVKEYPADPKFSQITIEYKKDETCDYDNVFSKLEAACLATRKIEFAYKIPIAGNVPCYAYRSAYVMSQTDMTKERNQDMKVSIVLLPQTNWTYLPTPPPQPSP